MGDIKAFADSLVRAREQHEHDVRQHLLKKMESLFNRWRAVNYVGFDATLGSDREAREGFEKALELLSDCYEELSDD